MKKKSAIGVSSILVALFLLPACHRKPAPKVPAYGVPPTRFLSPHFEFNYPSADWTCSPDTGTNGCHEWECHAPSPRAYIRVRARVTTDAEDTMDGNFVDFSKPNPCVPSGLPERMPELEVKMIQGTDWKTMLVRAWPHAGSFTHYYFKRAGKNVVQFEAITPSEDDEKYLKLLEPALQSLQIK